MVNARINWLGSEMPPDVVAAEEKVLRELRDLMDDTTLANLVFHTVFMGDTMYDASVFVAPCDDDPTSVDCWYSEKTTWKPLSDPDDDTSGIVARMRETMMEGPLPDSQRLTDADEI